MKMFNQPPGSYFTPAKSPKSVTLKRGGGERLLSGNLSPRNRTPSTRTFTFAPANEGYHKNGTKS